MADFKISMEAARVNAGLKQPELAEKIGVSVFTLRRWETGKSLPRLDQFADFCKAVGTEPEHIFLPNVLG